MLKSSCMQSLELQSLWNPFRDWNNVVNNFNTNVEGFKASETLLGIETHKKLDGYIKTWYSFKASETLLGIETRTKWRNKQDGRASKPLKPF